MFMRKSILSAISLVAMLFVLQPAAQAQVDLTLNPIGILFGGINVGADFGVSENFSIEATLGYGSNKILDVQGTNIPVIATGKYYFSPKQGADRFYADAFLRYMNRQWNYDDNTNQLDYTSNRFGIGFGVGYKVVSKGGFVFDVNLGGGRVLFEQNVFEGNGEQETVNWPDLIIQGKLGIGYRFGGKK